MRIGYSTIVNGKLRTPDLGSPQINVSGATLARMGWINNRGRGLLAPEQYEARVCYFFVRRQGASGPLTSADPLYKKFRSGTLLVFKMNPSSVTMERGVRVGVQQGLRGYVVTEGGSAEPRITLEGHFGEMLKQPKMPDEFSGRTAVPATKKLDGQQFWHALYEITEDYLAVNQEQALAGDALLELVWTDPIHGNDRAPYGFRWVVTPASLPSLRHTAAQQAIHPYRLELIGVRDDTVKPSASRAYAIPVSRLETAILQPTRIATTIQPDQGASTKTVVRTGTSGDSGTGAAKGAGTGTAALRGAQANALAQGVLGADVAQPKPTGFDFRFGYYAEGRLLQELSKLNYSSAEHAPASKEDYLAGARTLLHGVQDDPIWHTEEAKAAQSRAINNAQSNGNLGKFTLLSIPSLSAAQMIGINPGDSGAPYRWESALIPLLALVKRRLAAGLTPWGASRNYKSSSTTKAIPISMPPAPYKPLTGNPISPTVPGVPYR